MTTPADWRRLELTPPRLHRWWAKFHADHPDVGAEVVDGALELRSSDGTIARFTGWYPLMPDDDALARLVDVPSQIGIVLIRRGGYSVGLATGRAPGALELRDHKTGTRYVQSRTAAGGWSQQRFARRRENQADELVRAARDHAARVLAPVLAADPGVAGLVTGGDPLLVEALLAEPPLRRLGTLPRRSFPDVPDPRYKVLNEVVGRSGMVRVAVHNPPHPGTSPG